MTKKTAIPAYVATRGVSWKRGNESVDRDEGDDVSDAPAEAITDWLGLEPPAVTTGAEWAARAAEAAEEAGDGEA